MNYAELHCISNFSFLRGASHPQELVTSACDLGYQALAITDECSLAGIVKAHCQQRLLAKEGRYIQLIIGSEFSIEANLDDSDNINSDNCEKIIALATDKSSYHELSAFISLCRRRSKKGSYQFRISDLKNHLQNNLIIYCPYSSKTIDSSQQVLLLDLLKQHPNSWVGYHRLLLNNDEQNYQRAYQIACETNKPMLACGNVHMHHSLRKSLQDTLTAIRYKKTITTMGRKLQANAEKHLRSIKSLTALYPRALLKETLHIAERCQFSLDELRYQYPKEIVPEQYTASAYLRLLVTDGIKKRWPEGVDKSILQQIKNELLLVEELRYEYYFLTVHDIVSFARSKNILCQGRGSAANSIICYCLFITEVDPSKIKVLFERFISKERNEPPDIDVDFEHERREEVIQYIYKKYSRERAALAATVITYRSRSAIRDVGKALGFSVQLTESLSRSLGWWSKPQDLEDQLLRAGMDLDRQYNHEDNNSLDNIPLDNNSLNNMPLDNELSTNDGRPSLARLFMHLVKTIYGFPRHLSQHVGGFIISDGPISRLCPIENASMPDRTIIQWDKDDIEALGLLKVDILALGMLSAIRKTFDLVNDYHQQNQVESNTNYSPIRLDTIPAEDPATYEMLCRGDSIGVFQVESRAQISMLPRLKPKTFYDLVIQVAIVRPGPIQGNMVHPFLRRRESKEAVSYENNAVRDVLSRTLGVPIFQEQVIKLAMVAAGFSGGEADQLRRAMASWGKNGNLLQFRQKLLEGMLQRGHSQDFAERLFEQMKGFGSYGFPESHAASFALLVYISSWLKCHYPAAFYAALINSQPMGFYSPSQLVQDAKRHNISILPADINHSDWDCTLEQTDLSNIFCNDIAPDNQSYFQHTHRQHIHRQYTHRQYTHRPHTNKQQTYDEHTNNNAPKVIPSPAIRLGLRLVKGLSREAALRILEKRGEQEQQNFTDIADLHHRCQLSAQERHCLIRANAIASISGNRHQSHWQNLALDAQLNNLYASNQTADSKSDNPNYTKKHINNSTANTEALNDNVTLTAPNEVEDIRSDYQFTGLTLKRHPLLILRKSKPFNRCKRCIDLQNLNHKRFVTVAGIVTGRQKPGTASGVIFLTLEDETGNINIVVWQDRQQQFREILLKSRLLLVKGVLEKKNNVVHVIAGKLEDFSHQLEGYLLPSRDFH